jgi:REP element-mobilizing transposase RayT
MYRLKADAGDWHLFNRGSRRMALFRDDRDANVFLARLRKAAGLAGCLVWAYTLMTNHFHLVVRASSEQLGRFMHHLQRLYSLYHNKRWGLTGHAFAGPYGTVRQSGPAMLIRTLAYVFLNPVAARQADEPEDWSWTSYRSFMGIGESRLNLNVLPLLGEMGSEPGVGRRLLLEAISKAKSRLLERPASAEPTATEVHAQQFEWLLGRARLRQADLGDWDPIFLAIVWAKNLGVLRSAVNRVLGGPLTSSRRVELVRFRKWLESVPTVAERLRTP